MADTIRKCSECKTQPVTGFGAMCQACIRQWVTRWITEGIERGLHSDGGEEEERCSVCGQWKPRWAKHKQYSRIYICRDCDPDEDRQQQKYESIRSSTESKTEFTPQPMLIDLASMVGFEDRPDFEEYAAALACTLELIMRDPFFIDAVCVLWPAELMQLSPWMPRIGGMLPDGRMSWFEWINSVQVLP